PVAISGFYGEEYNPYLFQPSNILKPSTFQTSSIHNDIGFYLNEPVHQKQFDLLNQYNKQDNQDSFSSSDFSLNLPTSQLSIDNEESLLSITDKSDEFMTRVLLEQGQQKAEVYRYSR